MPTMIRSLVPPIAGYMSFLLFNTTYSPKKIAALMITVIGVLLGCLVELLAETESGEFKTTGFGILILLLSAFTLAS